MTFYQELQVNQAGSKKIIRESASQREKLYHIAVYLTKIAITVAFCFIFVSLYSLGFGADNSIVGVVVLLYLLVFRSAHLCIRTGQSTLLLAGFFGIMAVGPHAANLAGPVGGLFINAAAIALLILFGCHEPRMFNQSTLVLGYLLLYGYDVSGHAYQMRLFGLAVGALLVCAVFYGNHRGNAYELCAGDILPAFDLRHPRSKWQLCQIICSYRIFLPFVGITVSSRESAAFHNGIVKIAATKVSAGVSTGIGDHDTKYNGKEADEQQGDEQFEINDNRSLDKMYQDIANEGLQPVLNDYIYV